MFLVFKVFITLIYVRAVFYTYQFGFNKIFNTRRVRHHDRQLNLWLGGLVHRHKLHNPVCKRLCRSDSGILTSHLYNGGSGDTSQSTHVTCISDICLSSLHRQSFWTDWKKNAHYIIIWAKALAGPLCHSLLLFQASLLSLPHHLDFNLLYINVRAWKTLTCGASLNGWLHKYQEPSKWELNVTLSHCFGLFLKVMYWRVFVT